MLTEQTISKLHDMALAAMAEAYSEQRQNADTGELSFDDRFAMLVERQWLDKQNRSLKRRLARAHLRKDACVEDINWQRSRGLKRAEIEKLCTSEWVRYGQNCIITGPTGIGKSWLACALAQKACRDGYNALYQNASRMFRDLLAAQVDGTLTRLVQRLSRIDLLVIDDWGLPLATPAQYRHLLEVLEEREDRGSVMITSQYPRGSWHEVIGDPTVADAIMDRLVHNAHIIELEGKTMR